MLRLSNENINLIVADVEREGISFSHLKYDLIDHICCEVERLINESITFEAAYNSVKQKYADEGLIKIQNDTLQLLNFKYQVMKKVMKFSAIAGPVLIAFGTLFKILHYPGAGILLTLGFVIATLLYLPSMLITMYIENKSKKLIFQYISGFLGASLCTLSFLFKIMHWPLAGIMLLAGVITLSVAFFPFWLTNFLKSTEDKSQKLHIIIGAFSSLIYLIGFMFKILHWPGAAIILIVGVLLLLLGFFPLYIRYLIKKEEKISMNFIYAAIVITWFVITSTLISMKFSTDMRSSFVTHYKTLQLKSDYFENKCLSLSNTILNDTIESKKQTANLIISKTDEFCDYLHDCEIEIIKLSDNENVANVIDSSETINIDNFVSWTNNSVSENYAKDAEVLKNVEAKYSEFYNYISENISNQENEYLKEFISKQLTVDFEATFEFPVAITVLNNLEDFKQNARYSEYLILKSL